MKNSFPNQPENHGASRRPARPLPCGRGPRAVPPLLVAHVLNTLPDSLARRGELLQALAASIPPGQESAVRVRALQFHLQEHERLGSEWPDEADQP